MTIWITSCQHLRGGKTAHCMLLSERQQHERSDTEVVKTQGHHRHHGPGPRSTTVSWADSESKLKTGKHLTPENTISPVAPSPPCGMTKPLFSVKLAHSQPRGKGCRQKWQKKTLASLWEQPSFWHRQAMWAAFLLTSPGHVGAVALRFVLLSCSHLSSPGHSPVFSDTLTPVSPSLYVLLPPGVTSRPLWLTHPQPVQFLPKHHLDLPHMKKHWTLLFFSLTLPALRPWM